MTSLFEEIFGVSGVPINTTRDAAGKKKDDGAGMAAMSEEDLIKLEMHRKQSAQDSWNLLSDKEKLHYRMLMGGASSKEEEKN